MSRTHDDIALLEMYIVINHLSAELFLWRLLLTCRFLKSAILPVLCPKLHRNSLTAILCRFM